MKLHYLIALTVCKLPEAQIVTVMKMLLLFVKVRNVFIANYGRSFQLADTNAQNSNCTDYEVQLIDGDSANEGKVLVCINGVWGLLCSNSIGRTDANVICNQLGYSTDGTYKCIYGFSIIYTTGIVYSGQFSPSDTLLVADIGCYSSDTSIAQCSLTHFTRTSSCDARTVAAIRCHSKKGFNIMKWLYDSVTCRLY